MRETRNISDYPSLLSFPVRREIEIGSGATFFHSAKVIHFQEGSSKTAAAARCLTSLDNIKMEWRNECEGEGKVAKWLVTKRIT